MDNSKEALSLITFATRAQTQEIEKVIKRVGYNPCIVDGQDWLDNTNKEYISAFLIFLGHQTEPYSKIGEVLEKYNISPNLTIFPVDVSDWDNKLIDHSYEFVGWPCCENEILFRLERSCAHTDTDFYIADLDGFAELNLIGNSPEFLKTLDLVKRFSRFEVPVLIEAETGAGKGLVAQAIHYLSSRRDQPFIPVNCGSIPESLVENEFFGHIKGAYTDAKDKQSGLIKLADGGTLFLDEVNSLSLKSQSTLLRFLEDGMYRPLGSNNMVESNIRIITASNESLPDLIAAGGFREDLYYRLNLARLELKPLRDRKEDIPVLANYFLQECEIAYDLPAKSFHPDMMHWLKTQDWKGNIRELKNHIHQKFLLTDGPIIHNNSNHSPNQERRKSCIDRRIVDPHKRTFNQAKAIIVNEFEKQYLTNLLMESNGNVTQAAKYAGKERRAMGKLLKKHGISAYASTSLPN